MPTLNLKKSRKYSDLNFLFGVHPITKDVLVRVDDDAIKNSVKNLVLTRIYDRLFHPEIGCQVTSMLFEPFTPITSEIIKKTIRNVINSFEPRVSLIDVRVNEDVDGHSLAITIDFRIINAENPDVLSVTTFLERVR